MSAYDTATGERLWSNGTSFGRYLVVSGETNQVVQSTTGSQILVRSATDGSLVKTLSLGASECTSLSVSGDGLRLAATNSTNGNVRLWNLVSGQVLATIPAFALQAFSVALNDDGTKLVVSGRHTVGGPLSVLVYGSNGQLQQSLGVQAPVTHLSYLNTDTILGTDLEGRPVRYEIPSASTQRFGAAVGKVERIGWLASGTFLVSVTNGKCRLWSGQRGDMLRDTMFFAAGTPRSLATIPGGTQFVVGTSAGAVSLYSLASVVPLRTVALPEGTTTALCLSGDGKTLVAGGNHFLDIYALPSMAFVRRITADLWRGDAVSMSPNGRYVTYMRSDTKAYVYDVVAGADVLSVGGFDFVQSTYSADSQRTAVAWDNGSLTVRGVPDGNDFHLGTPFKPNSEALALSHDATHLSTWDNNRWRIFEIVSGDEEEPFDEELSAVTTTGVSPDGTRVAIGRADGTLMVCSMHWRDLSRFPVLDFTMMQGVTVGGGEIGRLTARDGWRMELESRPDNLAVEKIEMIVNGRTPIANPNSLRFRARAWQGIAGTTARLELWDTWTSEWDSVAVEQRISSVTRDFELVAAGDLARFVRSSDLSVRGRLTLYNQDVAFPQRWITYVDQLACFVR